MISFFSCQKVFYTSPITIDRDSFGKGIAIKRNIDWLNGVWFAVPKIRVGWEYMTLRLKLSLTR
jgi:hypothetical protein